MEVRSDVPTGHQQHEAHHRAHSRFPRSRMKFTVNEIAMAIGLLFPAIIMLIWLYLVRSEVQEAEAKKKIQ
jgi:sterol desaturase/sphingolipid hydroxylase (fatty acid hydroxylase superfamily)